MVDDGRNSSENGEAHSQLRYPLGYPKRVDLELAVDDHHALLGARLRRGSRRARSPLCIPKLIGHGSQPSTGQPKLVLAATKLGWLIRDLLSPRPVQRFYLRAPRCSPTRRL